MESSFSNPHGKRGIVDEEEDDLDSVSSSSSNVSTNSISSSSSADFMEDATSSSSSSSSDHRLSTGPLFEMSSLMEQLPFKRGLSKHFQGKSQSFTSLLNVRCLEDLAKPENPYKKKLKSCKSYGGLSETHRASPPKTCSRTISKKASRGSFSSLNAKRSHSYCNKPPIPPQRSASGLCNQTLLFT